MTENNRRTFLKLMGAPAVAAALPRQHQPRARHRRAQPHGHHRRRRARRHPHAGEPLVRPLLRHDARRPRLRRPARGDACRRGNRCGTSPTAPTTCCRSARRSKTSAPTFLPDPPHGWNDTHAAWNAGRHDQLGAEQGRDDDDVPHARRPALPVRARRCVHHLRQLLLLADGPDRPEPLPHVDRLGGQRRQRRRSGHHQRGSRLRLVDLSRAPAAQRHLLEGLPGHGRRPRRGGVLGLDRRPVHRQLRRQLAALLPPVPERGARHAARRSAPRPAP